MDSLNRIVPTNTVTNLFLPLSADQDEIAYVEIGSAPVGSSHPSTTVSIKSAVPWSPQITLNVLNATAETCIFANLYSKFEACVTKTVGTLCSPAAHGSKVGEKIELNLFPFDLMKSLSTKKGQQLCRLGGVSDHEKALLEDAYRSYIDDVRLSIVYWENIFQHITNFNDKRGGINPIFQELMNFRKEMGQELDGIREKFGKGTKPGDAERLEKNIERRDKLIHEFLTILTPLWKQEILKKKSVEDSLTEQPELLSARNRIEKFVVDFTDELQRQKDGARENINQKLADFRKTLEQASSKPHHRVAPDELLKIALVFYQDKVSLHDPILGKDMLSEIISRLDGSLNSLKKKIKNELGEKITGIDCALEKLRKDLDKNEDAIFREEITRFDGMLEELKNSPEKNMEEILEVEIERLDFKLKELNKSKTDSAKNNEAIFVERIAQANSELEALKNQLKKSKEEIFGVIKETHAIAMRQPAEDLLRESYAVIDKYELFDAQRQDRTCADTHLKQSADSCLMALDDRLMVLGAMAIQFHADGGYSYAVPDSTVEKLTHEISKAENTAIPQMKTEGPWQIRFLKELQAVLEAGERFYSGVSGILLVYVVDDRESLDAEKRSRGALKQCAKDLRTIAQSYGELKGLLEFHATERILSGSEKDAFNKLRSELEYRQFEAEAMSSIGELYAERFVPTLAELRKIEDSKDRMQVSSARTMSATTPDGATQPLAGTPKGKKKKTKKEKSLQSVTNRPESLAAGPEVMPVEENISLTQSDTAMEPQPDLARMAEERQRELKIEGARRDEVTQKAEELKAFACNAMKSLAEGITIVERKICLDRALKFAKAAEAEFDAAMSIRAFGALNPDDGRLAQLKEGCTELIDLCEKYDLNELTDFVKLLRKKFGNGQLSATFPTDKEWYREVTGGYIFEVVLQLKSSSVRQGKSGKGNQQAKLVELIKCYLHIHVKDGVTKDHAGILESKHLVCSHVKRPRQRLLKDIPDEVKRTPLDDALAIDLLKAAWPAHINRTI